MTAAQRSYLATLAGETGETVDDNLTRPKRRSRSTNCASGIPVV